MARTVTLTVLLGEIRWLADAKGLTVRHSDADITRALNQSIQRFREKVSNRGIRHYLTHTTGTLSQGPTSPFAFTVLDLSAASPGIVRVFGVDITYQSRIISLEQVDFESRNDFQRGYQASASADVPEAWANYQTNRLAILPCSNGAYPYTVWYLPVLADLVNGSDTFDGISGWELWLQWDVLVKLINRDKYGADYAMAVQERELVWQDIERNASPVKRGGVVRRYDARGIRADQRMRRRREDI